MTRPVKAIALISGGLDSTLALALVKRQGIQVKAVNFYTGFCITETQRRKGGRADGSMPQNEALRAAADLEVEIEYVDISGAGYLDMLVNPKYGYGANANPCVDCRIFMMTRARETLVICDPAGPDHMPISAMAAKTWNKPLPGTGTAA